MAIRTLVLLADGFEETEAVATIDMLRRADIQVVLAGLEAMSATGSHGITVMADSKLADVVGDFDAYILPGGPGVKVLAASKMVARIIQTAFQEGKLIAAICAAPAIVLAPLGILKNKTATCFSGMEKNFDASTHFSPKSVVVDGNVITSRGPATALLFGIAIVEKLAGNEAAEKLRKATMLAEMAEE